MYLIHNKTNSVETTIPSTPTPTEAIPILDDRYQSILLRRPQLSDFVEGDYYDAFDDSYHTSEGYKLRELLLLVWWGKSQKGKALDVRIPKYYYDRYELNPNEVTKRFFAEGLLEYDEIRDLVRPTAAGKELQRKYSKLWEIHSLKEYHANLDKEFANWDLDRFLMTRHKQKIEYLKASSQFYDDMANFLRKNYPKEKQDILYYQDAKRTDQSNITKLTELLDSFEK
ncbi:hypothetical protein [Streptococcus pluranimalium]|uniref:hypothetical protein n=1 Tax=Streptococcus pluranimalium TaxID=82348 RepID=UPI003F68D3A0